MSARLVGEVHAWLRSPAAHALDLTVSQRMVLSTIAERANETSREMWSHRGDGCTQFEYLMEVTGLKKSALADALNGLAEKNLEVRIQIGESRSGKPVFAHRGKATRFRLPELPASVALPGGDGEDPDAPVDNPVDESSGEPAAETESLRSAGPIEEKASGTPDPNGPKASGRPDPSPYKDTPSKDLSLTPKVLSPHLNLEGSDPAAATPPAKTSHHMGWSQDYISARDYLQTLADLGEEFMNQARDDLGSDTPVADRVIYAARIAHKGIPA